ncbi:MAG: hypothetical protein JWN98_2252 [Abditibacteriota bacterium]|nr:hypothetical protein [Abditibacteriota bacterium]
MKRLNNTEIIDYIDGTLSPERHAAVEAHLRENAEDAQIVADLKMATAELKEWDAAEPIRVGEDFWPKLRDKLPERPQRSPWRAWTMQLGEMLRPARSPMRLAISAAAVAAFLAIAASLFTPEQIQPISQANSTQQLTTEERAVIQRAVELDGNYSASQPVGAAPAVTVNGKNATDKRGDVSSVETGDEETESERIP